MLALEGVVGPRASLLTLVIGVPGIWGFWNHAVWRFMLGVSGLLLVGYSLMYFCGALLFNSWDPSDWR